MINPNVCSQEYRFCTLNMFKRSCRLAGCDASTTEGGSHSQGTLPLQVGVEALQAVSQRQITEKGNNLCLLLLPL